VRLTKSPDRAPADRPDHVRELRGRRATYEGPFADKTNSMRTWRHVESRDFPNGVRNDVDVPD
jgi:hypothetical protein